MAEDTNNSKDQSDFLIAGSLFGGKYVVGECIARGSKTVLYKCHQNDFPDRELVLGVLQSRVAKSDLDIQRFRKGISASYTVSHPNVIRTYDCLTDGELVGFTMDYAPNGSLDDLLNSKQLLPISEIIKIGQSVSAGLTAIHVAGIVHRDIRPKNILFDRDKVAKITGFYMALIEDAPRLTSHGEVVGTVGYASPEYLELGSVDKRSDIYALGLIIYEMITGVFPFSGENPIEAITARLKTDPKPPHELRSDCPKELSLIILKATARRPDQRYQTAAELLQALEGLQAQQEVPSAAAESAKVESVPLTAVEPPSAAIANISSPEAPTPHRRLLPLAFAALLVGVGLIFIKSENSSHESLPVETPPKETSNNLPNTEDSTPQDLTKSIPVQIPASDSDVVEIPAQQADSAPPSNPPSAPEPVSPTMESVSDSTTAQVEVEKPPPAPTRTPHTRTHRVVEGDTLNALAERYSVPPEEIIKLNNITNRNLLITGKVLIIPY